MAGFCGRCRSGLGPPLTPSSLTLVGVNLSTCFAAIAVALFQSDERLLTDNKQSFGQYIVGTVLVSTGPTSQ